MKMKNKVYVMYQISTQDSANINDIEDKVTKILDVNGAVEILGVYDDKDKALMILENEIHFQCDDDNNDDWSFVRASNTIPNGIVTLYYCGEPQYSIVLKEMEVE